jgi:hypothetical protein
VFRRCAAEEVLDAASGACLPEATQYAGATACSPPRAPVVVNGRGVCVVRDAACPRGTRRIERSAPPVVASGDGRRSGGTAASGAACERPPTCPPGAIADSDGCRPLATIGRRNGSPRIDLGAWVSAVLGVDGGPATPDVCRPLWLHAEAFAPAVGGPAIARIRVTLSVPDQDVSRVHVDAAGEVQSEGGARPFTAEAQAVVADSLATLVEPLRGLGGDASTAAVELALECPVGF